PAASWYCPHPWYPTTPAQPSPSSLPGTRTAISLLMAGCRLTLPSGSWLRPARAASAVWKRRRRERRERPRVRNQACAQTEGAPCADTHTAPVDTRVPISLLMAHSPFPHGPPHPLAPHDGPPAPRARARAAPEPARAGE